MGCQAIQLIIPSQTECLGADPWPHPSPLPLPHPYPCPPSLCPQDFLLSTMSGDVVELPVGGAIRRKASQSSRNADMGRLQTLADLLGMSQVRGAASLPGPDNSNK